MMMDADAAASIAASQIIVRENAKAARMQTRADLLTHLGKVMNAPDPRDFEFVCKDGVTLKACRMFFVGRSPVFDTMLTNGMLESNSSSVTLPEISGPALLAISEYLYTGDVVEHKPKDWRTGLEIISAAHFFLLPTIDKIVEEINMAHISNLGKDPHQAATMLSLALTFKSLSHDESQTILQLVTLLKSTWMQSDYAYHLSEVAVDFIMRHTKPTLEAKDCLYASLEEYFRFRGVIVWCICNIHFASTIVVDNLVNVAIPAARENLYVKGHRVKNLSTMDIEWLPNYRGSHAQDEIMHLLRSHGALEPAMRLLAHIEWVQIPPIILVKVVEPMKLVPESCLMDSFRYHSLRRMISVKLRWDHNKTYRVSNDGFVIQKYGHSSGSAICHLANRVSEDICMWRFIMKNADSVCQLGFVCSEGPENPTATWNCELDCLEAARDSRDTVLRVVECHPNKYFVDFAGHPSNFRKTDRVYVDSVATIEFQYRRSRQSCIVKVDYTNYGTVWTGLPASNIFPVLSLGRNKPKTSVELELVSGFDMF